jgi:hypothetical protein
MNRLERIAKRNERIFNDFNKQFNKGFRVDLIYNALADRYTLGPEYIARIVTNYARQQISVNQVREVP